MYCMDSVLYPIHAYHPTDLWRLSAHPGSPRASSRGLMLYWLGCPGDVDLVVEILEIQNSTWGYPSDGSSIILIPCGYST